MGKEMIIKRCAECHYDKSFEYISKGKGICTYPGLSKISFEDIDRISSFDISVLFPDFCALKHVFLEIKRLDKVILEKNKDIVQEERKEVDPIKCRINKLKKEIGRIHNRIAILRIEDPLSLLYSSKESEYESILEDLKYQLEDLME